MPQKRRGEVLEFRCVDRLIITRKEIMSKRKVRFVKGMTQEWKL